MYFIIKVSWLAKTTVINILATFFSSISFGFYATFVSEMELSFETCQTKKKLHDQQNDLSRTKTVNEKFPLLIEISNSKVFERC